MTQDIIQVPTANFTDNIMDHQMDFLKEFDSGKNHSFMLNWHRRARKTTMTLNLLIRECCRYPNRQYAYVAPTLKQGRSIIWLAPMMLNRYLPMEYVKRKNDTDCFVEFKNGSIFRLLGSEDEDAVRGTDAHGYIIDEWGAYSNPKVWDILRPILAQKRSAGEKPWVLFIFTPKGRNHAFKMWNSCTEWDGWYRSQLAVTETNIVTEDILRQEKQQMPPSLYRQEYLCDFTSDDENIVISYDVISNLNNNVLVKTDSRRFVSVDPSLGGDICPIMRFEGTKVVGTKRIIGERDPMVVVGHIVTEMNLHKTKHCVIDANGLGEGIAARISEMGYFVHSVRSQERVREDNRYTNKRAEMHFYVLEEMTKGHVAPIEDKDIENQLTSIRYLPMGKNGKISLEEKKETKKRIGRSPDDSDCYVMGIYELANIPQYDFDMVEKWRGVNRNYEKKAYAGGASGY